MIELGVNLGLAVGLFALNGWLGRLQYGYGAPLFAYGKFAFELDEEADFTGNFFLKIINPTIFMAVACGVMEQMGQVAQCETLWALVPLYWVLRVGFVLAKNGVLYVNWRFECISALVSIGLSYGVLFGLLLPLIEGGQHVFIPLSELRSAIWYAIIAYVGKTAWDIGKVSFRATSVYPAHKRKEAVLKRYGVLRKRYGETIWDAVEGMYPGDALSKVEFVRLVYGVMLYEDYNRPPLFRCGERWMKRLCPWRPMTLGIMQVTTMACISDTQSIVLGIAQLLPPYLQAPGPLRISMAVAAYNPDDHYVKEVQYLYEALQGVDVR